MVNLIGWKTNWERRLANESDEEKHDQQRVAKR